MVVRNPLGQEGTCVDFIGPRPLPPRRGFLHLFVYLTVSENLIGVILKIIR